MFIPTNNAIIAWKVSKYGVVSGPYFPVFGLNTEIYSIHLCIQSECRKIRTRNNSVFGHFSGSVFVQRRYQDYFICHRNLFWIVGMVNCFIGILKIYLCFYIFITTFNFILSFTALAGLYFYFLCFSLWRRCSRVKATHIKLYLSYTTFRGTNFCQIQWHFLLAPVRFNDC